MSSSDLAISVRGLGKSYTIRHQDENHITLAEQLLHRARHPLTRTEKETFWALKDVSFDVRKGEVLGVIGGNGAGKSTLLKLLSRITPPTTGEVRLYGRVGSLLEVGTGFHPELTGRENVYLNGAILGMRTKEIDRRFDEIVAFAGVQKFLDTPVKRFSSGMYVRLAFAVAAHLDTEILLIDEVLSVGDADFQKRSLGKMEAVAAEGRTVLFVSHQLDSVADLCDRVLVFEHGRRVAEGNPEEAIEAYITGIRSAREQDSADVSGSGRRVISRVTTTKSAFVCAEPKGFRVEVRPSVENPEPVFVAAVIRDDGHRPIVHCDSRLVGVWLSSLRDYDVMLSIETPWLKPGTYSLDIAVCTVGEVIELAEQVCAFSVLPMLPYPHAVSDSWYGYGDVLGAFSYHAEIPVNAR